MRQRATNKVRELVCVREREREREKEKEIVREIHTND
jgi:hypothetical protein